MKASRKNQKNPESEVQVCDGLTAAILESISDGVFTVDNNWKITSFNRAAELITGIDRKEAIGKRCSDVFKSSMCQVNCALKSTLKSGRPVVNRSCFIINNSGQRIPISVSTAVLYDSSGKIIGGAETFRDLSEIEALRKELVGRYQVGDLISRSTTMRKVFDLIPAVASTRSTILIQGETGTGKELVAKAIHGTGIFASHPFIAVNCGAMPDNLLESELFGYKKGAFTDAYRDKPGLMQAAENGTLFLDEIGDITPAMQVKLLRALQEKSFQPLGSTGEVKFKARVITATNKNLQQMVKAGTFREDLFYRINVVRIDLPPLRQRKEDIPLLVETFINKFNHLYGKQLKGVSNEALSVMLNHSWPGNIRELENLIERAMILCSGRTIGIAALPEDLGGDFKLETDDIRAAKIAAEAATIQAALSRNDFNINATANELGIHRATLYRKMKRYHLPNKP